MPKTENLNKKLKKKLPSAKENCNEKGKQLLICKKCARWAWNMEEPKAQNKRKTKITPEFVVNVDKKKEKQKPKSELFQNWSRMILII